MIASKRGDGTSNRDASRFFTTPLPLLDLLEHRDAGQVAGRGLEAALARVLAVLEEGVRERQLVAGIAKQYEPDSLVGRQVVVVANLQHAKLMGVESQGMVLAASADGAPVLLRPDTPVANGTPVQ